MAVLLDLPPELLGFVLNNVDVRDICHCYQACRRLRDVVIATPHLLYDLSLAAAGMIDGPKQCSLTMMQRLRLFQQRHEAWRTLEPTLALQTPNPLNVQIDHPAASEMRALHIDLDTDDMQHGLLTDSDFLDWRNDPVQDLLVIQDEGRISVEPPKVRYHFRTWSSRGSDGHPEAVHPYFDIEVDGERYDGTSWHIMGSFIAVVVRIGEAHQHLRVVDWKLDVTLLSVIVTGNWEHDVTDVQILDGSVVAVCTPQTIDLYNFRDGAFVAGPLVVLRLPMRRYTSCPASFHQQLGSMRENIPFTMAPYTGERIFVAHQSPYVAENGSRAFFYIMLVSSLLRLFREANQADAGTHVLQWNEWGPDNTRVLRNRADLRVDRLLSGTRVLWPTFDPAPSLNVLRYEILDFSRVPSARAGCARPERSLASDFILHEDESVTEAFQDGEQFIPAVQSRVPYSSATLSFNDNDATVLFGNFLDSVVKGWYPVELHGDRLTRVINREGKELGEVYVL
ncbi:hypothetical protein PENSPDRAFT_682227 [Peniophora sp. CONT]|nr:hypothetical protein PENSPDRAFT_682227 [Peniophora sp. CONT]